MNKDVRQQIKDIAEYERSNRRPIELSEVETRTESGQLVAPRRRPSGPITAVAAMALVLIVGGGLTLLFNTAQENPPADPVTPTTEVVPTTTPAESSAVTQIVTSDGPLNVTVEWRKLNETASRSGFEMDLPLFPGYRLFGMLLWNIDGEWVLPLQPSGLANESAERNNYAFSSDGYSWEIRPVLPGSPVTTEDLVLGFLLPDIRDGHPVLNQYRHLWNMWMNLPDDPGSPPEFVHHAYHDGNQWREVSFDAGFLVEAAGDEPVSLWSDLSCTASDTIAWYELQKESLEDGVVPPVILDGFLLINGDQATQLTEPPGARRPDGSLNPWGLVCWEDGTYSVSEIGVYHLQDDGWLRVASLPNDEIDPSQGWSPDSGYYMNYSGNSLWVTQDFESWETYLLPEPVASALASQSTTMAIHRRDGLWMVGSTRWGSPPEGLWISEDLETWELIPAPRLTNSDNLTISLPAEGLLVATDGNQLTRNIWVGRLTR